MIRAYVQNSALLRSHNFSFRQYLQAMVGDGAFPPSDPTNFEMRALAQIERDFYNVGQSLANYLICDWLFGLWAKGGIDWFRAYKADSVHEKAIQQGLLPETAAHNFASFCREVRIPAGYGQVSGQALSPARPQCLPLARREPEFGRGGGAASRCAAPATPFSERRASQRR